MVIAVGEVVRAAYPRDVLWSLNESGTSLNGLRDKGADFLFGRTGVCEDESAEVRSCFRDCGVFDQFVPRERYHTDSRL